MADFKQFKSGGKKDLTGKLPLHLIPPEVMHSIAQGLQCGISKGYEPRNWEKGLPYCEGHLGAVKRHLAAWEMGEELNEEKDKEGKVFYVHHLDNALTHLAMLVTQVKRCRDDLDDRSEYAKMNKLDYDLLIEDPRPGAMPWESDEEPKWIWEDLLMKVDERGRSDEEDSPHGYEGVF